MRRHQAALAGEAVPRTGVEAVVAAVNAVADRGAKLLRDRAFQLDGQVGDAAARVELERCGDCAGRAGVDAACAFAAVVALRLVRLQHGGGEDLGDEKPVAESAADEVGVFADKAKAGALAKVALEDRPGIDVPKRSGILAGERLDALGQLAKRLGECVVVIGVTRVSGDDAVAWIGGCVVRLAVARGQRDDGARAVEDELRVDALGGVALEPAHRAVALGLEPFQELPRMGRRVGGGDAAVVEAQLECVPVDGLLHFALRVVWRNWLRIKLATSLAERYSVLMSMSERL